MERVWVEAEARADLPEQERGEESCEGRPQADRDPIDDGIFESWIYGLEYECVDWERLGSQQGRGAGKGRADEPDRRVRRLASNECVCSTRVEGLEMAEFDGVTRTFAMGLGVVEENSLSEPSDEQRAVRELVPRSADAVRQDDDWPSGFRWTVPGGETRPRLALEEDVARRELGGRARNVAANGRNQQRPDAEQCSRADHEPADRDERHPFQHHADRIRRAHTLASACSRSASRSAAFSIPTA